MELLKKLSEGMWADDMAPMHRADAFLSRARVRQKEHAYQEALIYLEQAAQASALQRGHPTFFCKPSAQDVGLQKSSLSL